MSPSSTSRGGSSAGFCVCSLGGAVLPRKAGGFVSVRGNLTVATSPPNLHDSLGMAYQWAGRYAEAIQAYEKALSLNSRFDVAAIHLANTYVWQGRYHDAERQYQQLIGIASYDLMRSRAFASLAQLYIRSGKLDEAERAVGEAHKLNKQQASSLLLLALARDRLTTAEKLMAIIDAYSPYDRGNRGYERDIAYYRASYALKGGRADEAILNFTEAIRHRPLAWNIDAYEDCLANAYLQLGRFDEAITEYERILRITPNYPLVYYHLAKAYEGKGQMDEARSAYRRFLQIWADADADIPEVVAARRSLA